MKAGDIVIFNGEKLVVAWSDGDQFGWCGWPEGQANVKDARLHRVCSDADHIRLLEDLAKIGRDDRRAMKARETLAKMRA